MTALIDASLPITVDQQTDVELSADDESVHILVCEQETIKARKAIAPQR